MDAIDIQREAERVAKGVEFIDLEPTKPKQWAGPTAAELREIDAQRKQAKNSAAKRERRGRAVANAGFVLLLGAVAMVVLDYYGIARLGIFPAWPVEEIYQEAVIPAPVPAPQVHPAVKELPRMDRRTREYIQSLARGIDLMSREFAETEDIAAACRGVASSTAASFQSLSGAEADARTMRQLATLQDNRSAVAADNANANTRLNDCISKEQSLMERMEKAKTEIDALRKKYSE